jgi:hypothetical protein
MGCRDRWEEPGDRQREQEALAKERAEAKKEIMAVVEKWIESQARGTLRIESVGEYTSRSGQRYTVRVEKEVASVFRQDKE